MHPLREVAMVGTDLSRPRHERSNVRVPLLCRGYTNYRVPTTWYGVYTGTTHVYTLRRSDGAIFKFNDTINKVEALGNAIQREVTRVLLPRYIYAYNMGNTVTFGPLSINQQGISNSKEMLPWSSVKDLQVRRGMVSVKKEGKWFNWSTVGVARIPNFYVFMALVDYASKGRR